MTEIEERTNQINELKKGLRSEAEKIHITTMMDVAAIGTIQSMLWIMHRTLLLTRTEHEELSKAAQTAWDRLHAKILGVR